MSTILFEPHHDDAALFAAYTVLREKPDVITVMGNATLQEPHGITELVREQESIAAMRILEPNSWRSWRHSDINPDQDAIVDDMLKLNTVLHPKTVWAPLREDLGHEQHNMVAVAALIAFGEGRVRFYATYQRGYGRTRTETEVRPEPTWPALKLKAMACYDSQINLANCRPWFDDWSKEWIK